MEKENCSPDSTPGERRQTLSSEASSSSSSSSSFCFTFRIPLSKPTHQDITSEKHHSSESSNRISTSSSRDVQSKKTNEGGDALGCTYTSNHQHDGDAQSKDEEETIAGSSCSSRENASEGVISSPQRRERSRDLSSHSSSLLPKVHEDRSPGREMSSVSKTSSFPSVFVPLQLCKEKLQRKKNNVPKQREGEKEEQPRQSRSSSSSCRDVQEQRKDEESAREDKKSERKEEVVMKNSFGNFALKPRYEEDFLIQRKTSPS